MNNLTQKTLEILEDVARRQTTIAYKELYDKMGLNSEKIEDRNLGAEILGEVNIISIKEKNVMISCLVGLKDTNCPSKGFFKYAIDLKRLNPNASDDEKTEFWIDEVRKAHSIYR